MESNTRIAVFIGSGGVGKTTVAAGLGYFLAQSGRKVLVLTIDPSQRLATTLGTEGSRDVTRVHLPDLKGELYASVVDHKKVFDDFIKRATNKAESAEKIIKNKLYQQLVSTLSGSQDFTALEKLYSCFESGEYDWIILDTPPAKHAIDFLNAPQKLAALFNASNTRWFVAPFEERGWFSSLFASSTRQVIKILETLTGSEFIAELASFFSHIQEWQSELEQRAVRVHELLVGAQTEFFLVTSIDRAKLREASSIAKEIRKQGYQLDRFILNRALPLWDFTLDLNQENLEAIKDREASSEVVKIFHQYQSYFAEKSQIYNQFFQEFQKDIQVIALLDYDEPISDANSLGVIAQDLGQKLNMGNNLI